MVRAVVLPLPGVEDAAARHDGGPVAELVKGILHILGIAALRAVAGDEEEQAVIFLAERAQHRRICRGGGDADLGIAVFAEAVAAPAHGKIRHHLIDHTVAGEKILPEKTLVIFDEIQECPEALNTLKYFKEKANEYHVIAAGSLLGTLLAKPKSYPVGMVNLLDIFPLTFDEFLEATDGALFSYYESIQKEQQIEEIFHNRLLEAYNNYLIIGGMPECVSSWVKYKDPAKVSQIQRELVEIYENDFSKHNGKVNSGRILMVFRSIVAQLAKPNEKFMYGAVREGGRARDFEEAIEWLVSAGMLNRVYNVSKMEHPLTAFDKLDQFKLFVFDTGLLKHMAGIDNSAILLKSDYQFKGPLTENYVLQQLRGQFEVEPRYFSDKNNEIDFVLQYGTEIIPIEAKGGEDKSAPSFKKYIADHEPDHAIRFSKRGYRKDGYITNLPLYLARKTKDLL